MYSSVFKLFLVLSGVCGCRVEGWPCRVYVGLGSKGGVVTKDFLDLILGLEVPCVARRGV